EYRNEGRLAAAGNAGDADPVRVTGLRVDLREGIAAFGRACLGTRHQTCHRRMLAAQCALDERVGGSRRAPLHLAPPSCSVWARRRKTSRSSMTRRALKSVRG